jgi:hypothetical protein
MAENGQFQHGKDGHSCEAGPEQHNPQKLEIPCKIIALHMQ